jgi:ATP-dependent Lon protease
MPKKDTKKKPDNSDSDSDSRSDSGSESDSDSSTKKAELAKLKFMNKLFPSKHLSNKISLLSKNKKIQGKNNEKEKEKEKEKENICLKRSQQNKKCNKKKKRRVVSEEDDTETSSDVWADESTEDDDSLSESENNIISYQKKRGKKVIEDSSSDAYNNESDDEEEEDEEEEESLSKRKKQALPFNIVLEFGGKKNRNTSADDDEDSYWEEISEEDEDINGIDTEDEDEPVSSDSEDDDDESLPKGSNLDSIQASKKENEDLLIQLQNMPNKTKSVLKCIETCKSEIETCKKQLDKKTKKHREKNSRIFRKIIRDKNAMNDVDFFNKLNMEEQKKIIKELREINKVTRIEKPYRMTLLESNIPVQFKAAAMKKINLLRGMDPDCGEYYKIKNWVDTFMRMPFGKYESLNVSYEDGVERCHEFMAHAQKTLDQAVYGLNDAKMQIMQMLGQLITNPKALGAAIAIHGPPGTGKTSLVKEGISKILNRPFAFIALGGATDSSFLEGHSYTYEGSTWGKIVQILIDSKCMNPVIYFDELDKISETPKGEEIAGILTHLTDTSQNSQFHDKYFSEIDFDLSKCLFIFSYNDETKVNPILKDRMYRIQTKGYTLKQKTVISNQYLLPRIRDQVKFSTEDIIIPEETIHYLVDTFCNKEDGVRNLKRCLEIIHTKLNLFRLMKAGSNLFGEDMSLKVQFPFTVTKDIADKLIKKDKDEKFASAMYSLYV